LKDKWGMPASEKWMVAAGGADTLAIIDPEVWKKEAVEHNPDNAREVELIITHELVHVYHAQHNPSKDLDGMDDLGWFVEGLATYVSGQLALTHGGDARKAIADGSEPKKLADAWSGKYRYGVSGSMVEFVDRKFGRKETVKLLGFRKPDEVLGDLKLTEPQFLDGWKAFVGKPKPWEKPPELKPEPKPESKPEKPPEKPKEGDKPPPKPPATLNPSSCVIWRVRDSRFATSHTYRRLKMSVNSAPSTLQMTDLEG